MKRYSKWVIPIAFIVISNFQPFKYFFKLFIEGEGLVVSTPFDEYRYLTKDLKLVYDGYLRDTLNNTCYVQYTKMFPDHSHLLYRIRPMELWKFWRWSEYIFVEKWQQPYLPTSSEQLREALKFSAATYHTKNGFCSTELDNVVYPDSIVTTIAPAPKVSAE